MATGTHADCALCDHNYRQTFRTLTPDVPQLAVYDLDLIVEHEGRIFAIIEWKKIRGEFREYLIPAFEYIGLKKFGKMLRVAPYIVFEVVGADKFVVFRVDRFERDRPFKILQPKNFGKAANYAVFPAEQGRIVTKSEFRTWVRSLIAEYTRDAARSNAASAGGSE